MTHLDQEIEIVNPGAAQLLMRFAADPQDVAYRLSEVLPSIISVDFNPNASSFVLDAMVMELKHLSSSLGDNERRAPAVRGRRGYGGSAMKSEWGWYCRGEESWQASEGERAGGERSGKRMWCA